MNQNAVALVCLISVLLAVALGVLLYIYYGRVIMRSRVAGAPLELGRLLRMTFSGVNAYNVATAYLDARKAGVDISLDALEQQAKEQVNVRTLVQQLISKKRMDSREIHENV